MNEELLAAVTAKVLEKLNPSPLPTQQSCQQPVEPSRPRALLLGNMPQRDLGYRYVTEGPHEAVVIGSLTAGQLLHFRQEQALSALLEGMPVYLYTPGLPQGCKNRHLETELGSALNRLRGWGVLLTDGSTRRRLVTAQEARQLKDRGQSLPAGCILTPSAKDILE